MMRKKVEKSISILSTLQNFRKNWFNVHPRLNLLGFRPQKSFYFDVMRHKACPHVSIRV